MKQELFNQPPMPPKQKTLLQRLEAEFQATQYNVLYAASAYATVGGIRHVVEAAAKYTKIVEYRWILGLDDYFTYPTALELCRDLPNSQLRVASFSPADKSIFHPKVIFLSSSQKPEQSLLIMGSANLTGAALTRNVEAVILLSSETAAEAQELSAFWEDIWRLGKPLSTSKLQDYREKYKVSSRARQQLVQQLRKTNVKKTVDDATDEVELDASQASVCWIDVGKIVGGRELEFVASQSPFFDISPGSKTEAYRSFKVSDGNTISLRLKYRPNGMWRLELDTRVPEVAAGLKSGMERSPYVAVVERLRPNRFTLRFPRVDSAEYTDFKAKSAAAGTLRKTSTRSYGWF